VQNHKIVIQARVHTTCLPDKLIRGFFKDHSILDILCKRLLLYYHPSQIVIAGSTLDQKSKIASIAEHHGIDTYWGDEEGALLRVIHAAELKYGDHLIHVDADNPFLDIESMAQLVYSGASHDYCAFQYQSGRPSTLEHSGLFAEYVSASALKLARKATSEVEQRVDVCSYLYTHHIDFSIHWIPVPNIVEENQWIKLSLETRSDFERAQILFTKLIAYAGWKYNYKDIIRLVLDTHEVRGQMEKDFLENVEV